MYFDYSKTTDPMATTRISLKTVYKLEADSSYDVTTNEDNREGLIALRTIGGRGSLKIDGYSSKIVNPGTLIIFEYSEIRNYFCDSDKWNFWWFEFSANSRHLPLNTILKVESVIDERDHGEKCLRLLRSREITARGFASAIFTSLFYSWIFSYREKRSEVNIHQEAVDKVIHYMHSNLANSLIVKNMAHLVGLSERRFRQVFKEITGNSPKKYYDKIRLNMAKELLNNTSISVSEISSRLGYSSLFHFSKVFKKQQGIPPSYYRKRLG